MIGGKMATETELDPTVEQLPMKLPSGRIAAGVTSAWLLALGLSQLPLPSFVPESIRTSITSTEYFLISAGSLTIAYLALSPMIWHSFRHRREVTTTHSGGENSLVGSLLLIGVTIRLVGTVALFLVCRYQMDYSASAVAAITIGWYVYLTFVEVIATVFQMSRLGLQRSPQNLGKHDG